MIQYVPRTGQILIVSVWYQDMSGLKEGKVRVVDDLNKARLETSDGELVSLGSVTLLAAKDGSRDTANVVFLPSNQTIGVVVILEIYLD